MDGIFQFRHVDSRTERWDRAGVVVSTVCAVHCTLLPLVAGLLPIVGLQHFVDERIELTLVTLTALVGVVGHARAYRLRHRHVGPGLLFVAGLSLIVVTRLSQTETVVEPVALGCGGAFAAAAHWINLRLCRCCDDCGSAPALTSPVSSIASRDRDKDLLPKHRISRQCPHAQEQHEKADAPDRRDGQPDPHGEHG